MVKHKHEVFGKFVEWKSLVEKLSGYKVKKLRTNNGGEYTSTGFESYLKKEGIEHQHTIPKTPEQNGVSERMNRTLLETVRSMLADSRLPHSFWAEAIYSSVLNQPKSYEDPQRQDTISSLVWEETQRQSLASVCVFCIHPRPERREEETGSQGKEVHLLGIRYLKEGLSSLRSEDIEYCSQL